MAKRYITVPSSPAVYNVAAVARAVPCSEGTIRNYLRDGLLVGAQRLASGHVVLFDEQLKKAREIYERNKRSQNAA